MILLTVKAFCLELGLLDSPLSIKDWLLNLLASSLSLFAWNLKLLGLSASIKG